MGKGRNLAICAALALIAALGAAAPAEACFRCSSEGFCEAVEAGRKNCVDDETGCHAWGPFMQCWIPFAAMSSDRSSATEQPLFAVQTSTEPVAIENGGCQPIEVGLVVVPEPLAP